MCYITAAAAAMADAAQHVMVLLNGYIIDFYKLKVSYLYLVI